MGRASISTVLPALTFALAPPAGAASGRQQLPRLLLDTCGSGVRPFACR